MRVLVTGAAGFIGFHLSKRLLEEGCKVFGIDSLNDYYDVNLKKDRLFRMDATWVTACREKTVMSSEPNVRS